MLPTWIDSRITIISLLLIMSGCSTDKEKLLPHGENTMMDVWDNGTSGSGGSASNRQMLDARAQLRRPVDPRSQSVVHESKTYTRTAQNEIYSQFKRLPNPDLVMYVFPHLAGSEPAPIPGYTTVFPFYQRVQYAMPGERVEDY
ncbi:TIGR03751 family conjugal transfer lipoprotein [Pseudomonas cichorii]|uniref:TIGR03751 family conjugal transfer lipoprotein n=1 Tax=Pseudomonas cichorii TaxID=36746 RepID=UPI0018E5AE23|nr:TIGR03751 family conjugal transfer lipoprotein [Pseudomonas cichorii]MBI6855545.1 TIGR03751 family conjugal transfer lipoprotein [Pseudomonas cichorii]MBX8588604.1 TIGR03751 family conjugal transfer lipoprotein [Pseudomonas cichorii]